MEFKDRIAAVILKYQNNSIREFSERVGLSQSSISNITKGKSSTNNVVLEKIVKEYPINAYWLLTGEGEMGKGQGDTVPKAHLEEMQKHLFDMSKIALKKELKIEVLEKELAEIKKART